MTTTRPYRKAMPVAAALTELVDSAGTQFDPHVVETLLRVVGRPATVSAEEPQGRPGSHRQRRSAPQRKHRPARRAPKAIALSRRLTVRRECSLRANDGLWASESPQATAPRACPRAARRRAWTRERSRPARPGPGGGRSGPRQEPLETGQEGPRDALAEGRSLHRRLIGGILHVGDLHEDLGHA